VNNLLTEQVQTWSWPEDVEKWLRSQAIGFSLNMPCGSSKVGSIRVDLDKTVKPDIVADLKHPPFLPQSFDMVICDPPFNFYNRFKWIRRIEVLAKNRLIFSSPLVSIKLRNWSKSFHIIETAGKPMLRLFCIFDRENKVLT
jgi:16S rRNA G966 N2-methylase RsmD